jgi:hypothetical protein
LLPKPQNPTSKSNLNSSIIIIQDYDIAFR